MIAALHSSQNSGENFGLLEGLAASIAKQPGGDCLQKWLALADGKLSFIEFYLWAKQRRKLTFLTVDITPLCDLFCEGICYYHPDISKKKPFISESLLCQAISDASEYLDLSTLIVAGKEPFLNSKRFFSLLRSLPVYKNRTYTIGTVTNGCHLHRHWDEIQDLVNQGHLDFLDISLDSGFAEEHDSLRGKEGTFELATNALRETSERLESMRIGVTSVFRGSNEEGLLELLRIASSWTQFFYIAPMQPPPYSMLHPLKVAEVIRFLHRLHKELENLNSELSLEITFLLPGLYVMEAVEAGLFSWDDLVEDERGSIYVTSQVNGHTLVFALAVLTEQAWRVARITYDGAYLAHLHFMQNPTPETYATGFLQKDSIANLYEKSLLPGTPFQQIILSRMTHQCAKKPCWITCFGGWSVAENAMLTGDALNMQPKLCVKGREYEY